MRHLLTEVAWCSVAKDQELVEHFAESMPKIVAIASVGGMVKIHL